MGEVNVTIVNCSTHEPIPDASVTDGINVVDADSSGLAVLYIDDSYSEYTIQISASGYESTTATLDNPLDSTSYVSECLDPSSTVGAGSTDSCIIASACLGPDEDQVALLRQARDAAISSDPVARDFFHIFWSRYYEWSPSVARLAGSDPAVAKHIRWGFLEPWLGYFEFLSLVGQRRIADLSEDERTVLLERLARRRDSWLAELPSHLESKRRANVQEVYDAFERFRAAAQAAFDMVSKTPRGSA